LYSRLWATRLQAEVENYNWQKEKICELFWSRYGDMPPSFVASAMRDRDRQTGQPISVCVWQEGLPAYLPRAERVAFVRLLSPTETLTLAACSWDRACEVVGHLMTPLGMYPERFQVRQFPSSELLLALGVESWANAS
jgi:hypothetical protein